MKEFTVETNFEGATAGGNQPRIDPGGFSNFVRQTGGARLVVSSRAVFDRDFVFHWGVPLGGKGTGACSGVKRGPQIDDAISLQPNESSLAIGHRHLRAQNVVQGDHGEKFSVRNVGQDDGVGG